ncbi:hypothetical protein OG979_21110 [Actinomadura citrea]|uniref:hypothetical protein n=1 Tax=Actinomadura citrea TaxID=46158 RepID=UPI002E2E3DED|nr:hypothetical protein [Actinomadura citrea]
MLSHSMDPKSWAAALAITVPVLVLLAIVIYLGAAIIFVWRTHDNSRPDRPYQVFQELLDFLRDLLRVNRRGRR